jgi:hypothetical protein
MLSKSHTLGSTQTVVLYKVRHAFALVDDGERHVVILTIWDADAETKVYWRSLDGNAPKTTIIPGKGIQTFQTAGEFKLEAIGEPNREVEYGYVLLGLRK